MTALAEALEAAEQRKLTEEVAPLKPAATQTNTTPAAPLVVATITTEFVASAPVETEEETKARMAAAKSKIKTEVELTDRLITAYQQAVEQAKQLGDPRQQDIRLKQLWLGRIRKSKVIGVTNAEKVVELIIDTVTNAEPLTVTKFGDVTEYRFSLPSHYRAYARCIKLGVLLGISKNNARFVEMLPFRKPQQPVQIKLHAPQLNPFYTDVIVFKINEKTGILEDWHAGDDPALHPAGSVEDAWVHCGVDLQLGE